MLAFCSRKARRLRKYITRWRHQMETFSALLTICAGNSPVPGKFPTQRPVTRSFDVFFDLRLNKRLSKQSWGWCFQTLSRPLWRHHDQHRLHTLWPGDAMWCQTLWSLLVQVLTWHLISEKLNSVVSADLFPINSCGTVFNEILLDIQRVDWKKIIWKCRLRYIGHFVFSFTCLT